MIITHCERNKFMKYAVALGNFDGLHLGHRCVIETAKVKAWNLNCRSAVITFSPHPMRVLRSEKFFEILTLEQKIQRIREMGIDDVFVMNFDLNFSHKSAQDFIFELCNEYDILSITTGYNFAFGHNRSGNILTLHELKKQYNFEFNAIQKVFVNGISVSSSNLRQIVRAGCMKLFYQLTHDYYNIDCSVSHKDRNVFICEILRNDMILLPPAGIYHARVEQFDVALLLMASGDVIISPINNCELLYAVIKVDLISIIRQVHELDMKKSSEILMNSLREVKFCIENT